MRWFKCFPIGLLLASGAVIHAEPAKASVAEAAAASPAPAKADDKPAAAGKNPKAAAEFEIPVPKNMPVHGIKIPHRDDNGRLVMVLEAEVANKLDDQHIEMTNLKIDAFDDDGKKICIELPLSVFNLDSRVLVGKTHALVRREDFEITGDELEFNTKTRHGTVRGNVKMTIQTPDNPQ